MNKWLISILLGLGAALFLGGIWLAVSSYRQMVVVANKEKNNSIENQPTSTPTPDPLASYSILLMGYGGRGHEGGLLTDSIMVVKIDPRTHRVKMVSVPRDLWVQIPISGETNFSSKINAAYAIGSDDKKYPNKKIEFTGPAGGGEMAKKVVGEVVGFKIDYFVALDFKGFVKMIDLLGGVDINVAKTFDDPLYPIETSVGIGDSNVCGKSVEEVVALTATMSGDKLEQQFPCRYSPLHFDKGIQHMDGELALKFARSRHSPQDGGDFNRAARQRLVIESVKTRILSIGFIPKILPSIKILAGNMTTDIDLGVMNKLISVAPEVAGYTVSQVALTDKNVLIDAKSSGGQAILSPRTGENNWDEVRQYIANPDSVVIATPTVIKVKTKIISPTQIPAAN